MTHEFYLTPEDAIKAGRPANGFIVWYMDSNQCRKIRPFENWIDAKAHADFISKFQTNITGKVFVEATTVYGNLNYSEIVEVI